jgi:RHS repeat-associated protein
MRTVTSKWTFGIGFVLVLFSCAQVVAATAQWSNGYSYRRAITIDHTKVPNTDQTNFPVLISGTYSYLKTTANKGNVTNANGYDIIFTSDGTGTNILPYERDSYNASTGAVNFWVQIPTVSHSSDSVFYIFYGNSSISADQSQPSQVWDSNYRGVWHLPNGSTLTGADSTANGYALTNNNGTAAATGEIGGAASFNGTNNYLSNSSLSIPVGSSITISFWNYVTASNVQNSAAFTVGNSDTPNRIAGFAPWSDSVLYWDYGTDTNPGGRVSINYSSYLGAWTYVTLEYNGNTSTHAIYLNGNLAASSVNLTTPTAMQTGIDVGAWPGGVLYDHATIDEFRVSATARSADWIATEYSNQNSPSTFYTIQSADTQGSNSYSYSRPITIGHTNIPNTDQPNFPVLISGTYSYLATTSNGGNVTSSNGYDIIFTSDPAGANPLHFERESYNSSTGAVIFWVQVPSVSHTTDTVFYMFYGNSSVIEDQAYGAGVWDSNYKGVWHMGNGTTLSTTDSTVNSNNATVGGSPSAVTGQISGAANFAGSPDLFAISSISLSGVSYTISTWFSAPLPSSTGWNTLTTGSSGGDAAVTVEKTDWQLGEWDGTGGAFHGCGYYVNVLANGWHYMVAVGVGNTTNFYIDGSYVCQSNIKSNNSVVHFGNNYGSQQFGKVDETRISTGIARSADWIKAEYTNQNSPSTFYTIGSAISGGSETWGPTITSLSPASGSVDTPVAISGTNFGAAQNGSVVNFNGVLATVTSWSNTSIVALVPDGAASGNVTVRISGVTSNAASFTVTGPVISTLSPTQGTVSTSVTITGTGFGSTRGSSTVTFNGTAVTTYSSWSAASVTVTVPSGATSGGVIVTVSNVHSDDAPFTVTATAPSSTSDIYYYFSDALGTARVITASDGTVCYDADLYPYGGVRAYNLNCAPNRMFTTYERDPESNNDYAMARYYSSRLGRFMSPDPTGISLGNINDPQSLNLYSYVRNNSTSMADPSGLCGENFIGGGGGGDGCGGSGGGFGGGGFPILGWDWGHGDWGDGPEGPTNTPANVGNNPNPYNGTPASDDPFSGETNGIPNGLRIPTLGSSGLLMPSALGCGFGACGNGLVPVLAGAGAGICAIVEPCGITIGTGAVIVAGVAAVGALAAYLLRPWYQSRQDKKLSPGEIQELKDKGYDPETIKDETFPGAGGKVDLYKTPDGEIVVKGKGGVGPGEPTGINIKRL